MRPIFHYICMNIHTYIHTYAYIHTYIHIHAFGPLPLKLSAFEVRLYAPYPSDSPLLRLDCLPLGLQILGFCG